MHYLNMALIDKASLLMVPSTYEAGTLYNVLPSGNRAPDSTDQNSGYDQTRADFTFDRGSNAAATRVNADGLIEKYRENLLLQSNQFDTTWTTSNASVTSGQSGYDGSSDAWLLSKSAATGRVTQTISSSGVNTFSLYAKAGTLNFLAVELKGSQSNISYYDLSTGAVTTEGGQAIDTNINLISSGWYRIDFTTAQAITEIRVFPADANGDLSGTTGSIYIQNAQLESGMVSTDYLDSGATTAKAGVLIDLPRINYDANGENGALLLEPSRQNLCVSSELLDDTFYSNIQSEVATNVATSPEGVQNASLIKNTNGDGVASYIRDLSAGMSTSTAYTTTIYAKYVNCQYIFIRNLGVANQPEVYFDIQNGVVGLEETGLAGDIEPMGNGWYRCIATGTTASSISVNYIDVGLANDDDGSRTSNLNQSAYLYGFQNEAGSYVSSYIPNHGTSGGVTRAADSCSVTGVSDVIGQTEGTLFLDFIYNGKSNTTADNFNLTLGTWASNIITIGQYNAALYARIYASSVLNFNQDFGVMTIGQRYKCAIAYATNDAVFYVNGVLQGSDTSVVVPAVSSVSLNRGVFENSKEIKQAALFKTRLTNEELATLTTL